MNYPRSSGALRFHALLRWGHLAAPVGTGGGIDYPRGMTSSAPSALALSPDRYRYRYSLADMATSFKRALRAFPVLREGRRSEVLGGDFIERIMLAVTEVNGCAVCSYAHAGRALEEGMDSAEISALLGGNPAAIREEEAKALAFGQHYADSRGNPDPEAVEVLFASYGVEQARLIIAAVQLIMAGNIAGLRQSALRSRRHGRPYANSSLSYEIGGILAAVALIPVAAVASRRLSPHPEENLG